jgi:hypothetical protein
LGLARSRASYFCRLRRSDDQLAVVGHVQREPDFVLPVAAVDRSRDDVERQAFGVIVAAGEAPPTIRAWDDPHASLYPV